jgi:hypothetical protein
LQFFIQFTDPGSFHYAVGLSSATRQMLGDLCTTLGIIQLSPLSIATDVTLRACDLWLVTRSGADCTATVA